MSAIEYVADRITLTQTCWACPEQYDAFLDGKKVGYLRLRHGHFTVTNADQSYRVYEAYPEGDGIFEDHEREDYLRIARIQIVKYVVGEPVQ